MDKIEVLELMGEPFGRRMLDAIEQAYQVRQRRHDAGIGDNAMTFGMNVRFTVEKLLENAFAEHPGLKISRPMGSFQIAYHGHIFHFYKFGMNANDSIENLSLDDSTTKINLVLDNQLSLPGIPALRHWIVAHSGNPRQGLIEVYIGAPNTLGERGSPWAWREQIFSIHEQRELRAPPPSFFGAPSLN